MASQPALSNLLKAGNVNVYLSHSLSMPDQFFGCSFLSGLAFEKRVWIKRIFRTPAAA
jgi:hypothetical protein